MLASSTSESSTSEALAVRLVKAIKQNPVGVVLDGARRRSGGAGRWTRGCGHAHGSHSSRSGFHCSSIGGRF